MACLYLLDHSASSAGKFPHAIYLKGERFESTMEICSHLGTCSVLSWEEVQEPGNIFWFLYRLSDAKTDFLCYDLYSVHSAFLPVIICQMSGCVVKPCSSI